MKRTLLLLTIISLPFSYKVQAEFSDIPLEDSLYVPTEYLKTIEVVKGYEDGSFGKDKTINRAEALKIILVAAEAEINSSSDKDFGDVPRDAWFAPFVYHAANQSIVSGDGDTGLFAPGRDVNRAEFVKMVLKTFEIDPSQFTYEEVAVEDLPDDAWFTPSMKFALKFEILNPGGTKANPSQPVTRGEAATILFNTLERGKGLKPQVMLDLMENHLIDASTAINDGESLLAAFHIGKSKLLGIYLNNLGEYFPSIKESSAVNTANAIVDAMESLIKAYVAGENGDKDAVIALSKEAWGKADAIPKQDGTPTTMETEIKKLAGSMADQARAAESE